MLNIVSAFTRSSWPTVLLVVWVWGRPSAAAQSASTDPLPSWNDGAAKSAIVGFGNRVTEEGSADFVPAEQRIATFDNDGHALGRAADLLPVGRVDEG